jgi:hypothetical protein
MLPRMWLAHRLSDAIDNLYIAQPVTQSSLGRLIGVYPALISSRPELMNHYTKAKKKFEKYIHALLCTNPECTSRQPGNLEVLIGKTFALKPERISQLVLRCRVCRQETRVDVGETPLQRDFM